MEAYEAMARKASNALFHLAVSLSAMPSSMLAGRPNAGTSSGDEVRSAA